jgi:hypothetical protein
MLPGYLTHYYEAETGPFKNVCNLSRDQLDRLISSQAGLPALTICEIVDRVSGAIEAAHSRPKRGQPASC